MCTDCIPSGPLTFRLPSPAGAVLWTTTPMDKVLREAAPSTTAFTRDASALQSLRDQLGAYLEGQVLFDDEPTTPAEPYQVRSLRVDVQDGAVTLEIGQQDEYTMLNWMSIVPAE